MAIGFMSFGGMLTGGDEEEPAVVETEVAVSTEQQNDIANNTNIIE